MKYRELEYSRNFNLGNYESERITLKVDLDETEDLDESYRTLKATVFRLQKEGGLIEGSKKVVEAAQKNIEYEKILWNRVKNQKGEPYERYPLYQQQPDTTNIHYVALVEKLKKKKFHQHGGLSYFLFDDQKTIGRKPVSAINHR